METVAPSGDANELMVPCDLQFAFLGEDGLIEATVAYHKDPPELKLTSTVYARTDRDIPAEIPLPGEPMLGRRVHELERAGTLVPFPPPAADCHHLYRVDDWRTHVRHTYMVWLGGGTPAHQLPPGVVFGFFPDGKRDPDQVADYPVRVTQDGLSALMAEARVTPMLTREDFGLNRDTERIPRHNGVVVWDMGSVQRSLDRGRTQ